MSDPAPVAPPAHLSLRKVQALLGLPAHAVAALVDAGVVTPTRGPRQAWRFSFQDVVLLRTAHRLRTAHVPPRKLLRVLARLKGELPSQLPLSAVRLSAVDRGVVVHDGPLRWEAESGQLLLDLDAGPSSAPAAPHPMAGGAGAPAAAPVDWYAQAQALESQDTAAAEQAYRRALSVDPGHADAWVDLSALLCEEGRPADAVGLLGEALQGLPDDARLHFNLGIALEDLQQPEEAIAAYERCLQLQPGLADAHFNLARLHERAGHPHQALRHFHAYRRLAR